jgi:hypothetical protein
MAKKSKNRIAAASGSININPACTYSIGGVTNPGIGGAVTTVGGNIYTYGQIGAGGNIINPTINWPYTISTTTIYKEPAYPIMKLPEEMKNKMPESVFVFGMLKTLGMFGSNVDCAFTGKDLIFSPGVINNFNKVPVSLYYKKSIYHFSVLPPKKDTNIVETELLSIIKR